MSCDSTRRRAPALAVGCVLALASSPAASGEIEPPAIRFDGIVSGVTSWLEDGLLLETDSPIYIDEFVSPDPPAIFASVLVQTFWLRPADGGVFDLYAFDARETNDSVGPVAFSLHGRTLDGALLQADFTSDGVCCADAVFGYETFSLPPTFRQLAEVEWSPNLLTYDTFQAVPVPPANDDVAAAIALDVTGAERRGTLVRASNDGAVTFAGSGESRDVWYSLAPAEDTTFVVDTCGTHDARDPDTGPDTLLTVHSALPAGDANQLAANDEAPEGDVPDACAGADGGQAGDAALRVEVEGGTTAWIRVSLPGDAPDAGDFVLHVPQPGATTAGAAALATLGAIRRRRRAPRGA
jgi:hypothetical protein